MLHVSSAVFNILANGYDDVKAILKKMETFIDMFRNNGTLNFPLILIKREII